MKLEAEDGFGLINQARVCSSEVPGLAQPLEELWWCLVRVKKVAVIFSAQTVPLGHRALESDDSVL